jgi:hypothetical protein
VIPNKEEIASFLRAENSNEIEMKNYFSNELCNSNVNSISNGSTNKRRKLSLEQEEKKQIRNLREKRDSLTPVGINASENKAIEMKNINFCKDNEIYKEILQSLEYVAKVSKLRKCEYIKKIIIISEGFCFENGLLTPTLKVKRKFVENYFFDQIKNINKD